jgi:hypothetical protein
VLPAGILVRSDDLACIVDANGVGGGLVLRGVVEGTKAAVT